MAAVNRHQGDDIPILISLTDSNGDAINIDNLAELYVYVVFKRDGTLAKEFNKAGSGDAVALRKITTTSYAADWKSGSTKSASVGMYNLEVNLAETDAVYESSRKNTIGVDEIIYLKKSTIKAKSSG